MTVAKGIATVIAVAVDTHLDMALRIEKRKQIKENQKDEVKITNTT